MTQTDLNRKRARRMIETLTLIGFNRASTRISLMVTLAHLRHVADYYDLDFGEIDRKAYTLYLLEKEEKDDDPVYNPRQPGL